MALQDQPELQQTDLGQMAMNAAGTLEKHAKSIIIGVVVVIAVLIAAVVISNSSHDANVKAWDAFAAANSAEDFANVSSDFPGTPVALWARLNEAEFLFREAVRLQFTDREAADGQMKKAGEAFDAVLANSAAPVEARERALLGRARLLEATAGSNDDIQKAIAAYQEFQKAFPQSPVYGSTVEARIKSLESEESLAFYTWFAKQTPKPEDREQPNDGMPGGFPTGHPDLPVTLPNIPEELYPADWKPEEEEQPTAPELILPAPENPESDDSDTPEADSDAPADAPSSDAPSSDDSTPDSNE